LTTRGFEKNVLIAMYHTLLILQVLIVLCAVVFLVLGGNLTWYEVEISVNLLSFVTSLKADFSLREQQWSVSFGSSNWNYDEKWTSSDSYPNVKQLYVSCGALTLAALILFAVVEILLVVRLLKDLCRGSLFHTSSTSTSSLFSVESTSLLLPSSLSSASAASSVLLPGKGDRAEHVCLLIGCILGDLCAVLGCLLLLDQPNAFQKDFQSYIVNLPDGTLYCQGVCQSFSGSSGGYTWGPQIGWWFDIAGCASGIIALFLMIHRNRKWSDQTINTN